MLILRVSIYLLNIFNMVVSLKIRVKLVVSAHKYIFANNCLVYILFYDLMYDMLVNNIRGSRADYF